MRPSSMRTSCPGSRRRDDGGRRSGSPCTPPPARTTSLPVAGPGPRRHQDRGFGPRRSAICASSRRATPGPRARAGRGRASLACAVGEVEPDGPCRPEREADHVVASRRRPVVAICPPELTSTIRARRYLAYHGRPSTPDRPRPPTPPHAGNRLYLATRSERAGAPV
jgi:hypothetical protein